MSKADIVITLLLALGGFLGYRRGFLMELFFLCSLVLGVLIGFRLMGAGVDYLHREFNADNKFLPYISFLIIFILVVLAVTFLGKRIKNSMDKTFLGRVDAIAGAVLSILTYAFGISILLWLVTSLHVQLPVGWTEGSWLYPRVVGFAGEVSEIFGGFMPFFREIFKTF